MSNNQPYGIRYTQMIIEGSFLDLNTCVRTMCNLSKSYNDCRVITSFNGVKLTVFAGSTHEEVVRQYDDAIKNPIQREEV